MPVVSNESEPGSRVGHEVDRTFMDAVGVRLGTDQVFVQVDSGAVPVGELVRPKRNPMDKTQELTPVRLPRGAALLTIRHSGRDDFWDWQDRRDKKRFQRRRLREGLNRFRGPRKQGLVTEGTEKLDLDGLSPLFQGGDMA